MTDVAKVRHRPFCWRDDLSPTTGRLWRILKLANGEVVTYEEISRRLCLDHMHNPSNSISGYVMMMRKQGYTVRVYRKIGLSMKGDGR